VTIIFIVLWGSRPKKSLSPTPKLLGVAFDEGGIGNYCGGGGCPRDQAVVVVVVCSRSLYMAWSTNTLVADAVVAAAAEAMVLCCFSSSFSPVFGGVLLLLAFVRYIIMATSRKSLGIQPQVGPKSCPTRITGVPTTAVTNTTVRRGVRVPIIVDCFWDCERLIIIIFRPRHEND
jgi:hypothetical protein